MTAFARADASLLRRWCWTIGAIATLLVGCGEKKSESIVAPIEMGNLEAGVVARVGADRIVADEVARIAVAQRVSAAAARDLAIHDALYAAEAKAEGADAQRDTQLMINAALARRLLRKLLDDADRAGPVTDAELERVMKRRWLELDRPEGFRVVHAVVRVNEKADEAARNQAKEIARAVREALVPIAEMAKTKARVRDQADPVFESFKQVAESVEHKGFEIKVEELPPISADARFLVPDGGGVEKEFADGAAKLDVRGALGEIVTTSYGFHVMLLLERIPEARVSVEQQRVVVREEVLWMRSSEARAKLIDRLRKDAYVGREVETLLVMVPVDR